MPGNRTAASAPHPGDDQFEAAIRLLRSRPRRERAAIVNFVLWWFGLPKEIRAAWAKIVRPGMTTEQTARLCGMSSRRLARSSIYRRSEADPSESVHFKRKPTKRRRDHSGGWWSLNHPDRPDPSGIP